VVELDHFRM